MRHDITSFYLLTLLIVTGAKYSRNNNYHYYTLVVINIWYKTINKSILISHVYPVVKPAGQFGHAMHAYGLETQKYLHLHDKMSAWLCNCVYYMFKILASIRVMHDYFFIISNGHNYIKRSAKKTKMTLWYYLL